ncbi:MAG: S8 family peptidase [Muribaculaceae bacterium]|nr:S8 family peptidase [Muribaculaceae bacterium]
MTNKIILASVFLLAAGYVSAQNKLNPAAIEMLENHKIERKLATSSEASAETVCAIVTLDSQESVEQFLQFGFDVTDVIGNMVLCDIPLDSVEALAALDYVVNISFGNKANILMDNARPSTGVDKIHAGTGFTQAYTGKGVVTGLFDSGLDAQHINFMDENGVSRVKGITTVIGAASKQTIYDTASLISRFTTENVQETHGTHVLGIMSGSYKGSGKFGGMNVDCPYYGIATESDIVIGCGDLYDNNILKGVRFVLDRAKALGEPAVVNLSIGTSMGTHDGLSPFGKVLDEYAKEGVIVMAAGNEGSARMGVAKTFTADDKTLATTVFPVTAQTGTRPSSVNGYNGQIQFYSSDSRPFRTRVVIINRMTNEVVDEFVLAGSSNGAVTKIGGSATGAAYKTLKNFDDATSSGSSIEISSNVGTDNNRYGVTIKHYLDYPSGGRYYLGFILEGEEGQKINGYTASTTTTYTGEFYGRGIAGWMDGSENGTINEMACGKNIIVVGSYNTRTSWPAVNGGGSYKYNGAGYDLNDVSGFSSYGTLYDGRNLPHFCAPGCGVISSFNYYALRSIASQLLCGVNTDNRLRTYDWGNTQGTSMAAPHASGVFALWLEANPNLTGDKIREIAINTATKDAYTAKGDPIKWGAGKLNAVEGLKEAIRLASAVGGVAVDQSKIVINSTGNRQYDIFAGDASNISASLYNLSGVQAAAANVNGDNLLFNIENVPAGIYILEVNADGRIETQKVALK